jgi:hypothetical protein
MATYQLISSDSHIIEPADLWQERMITRSATVHRGWPTRRRLISGMWMASNSGQSGSINRRGCGLRHRSV